MLSDRPALEHKTPPKRVLQRGFRYYSGDQKTAARLAHITPRQGLASPFLEQPLALQVVENQPP